MATCARKTHNHVSKSFVLTRLDFVQGVWKGVPTGSCCNTPDVTCHICNSNSCHFRLCDMIFPPWLGFPSFCILFMSCISYHVIMCIAFAYVFISLIRAFSPLSVLQSGAPMFPGVPFYILRERVLNF